jgi:hypothetical protein
MVVEGATTHALTCCRRVTLTSDAFGHSAARAELSTLPTSCVMPAVEGCNLTAGLLTKRSLAQRVTSKRCEMHYRNLSGGRCGSVRQRSTGHPILHVRISRQIQAARSLPIYSVSCSADNMAKSARSSRIKKNNQALKKKIFGPVETARNERQNAKLLELAQQPKPVRTEMEVEKDGTPMYEMGNRASNG